ncbi:response regulator [Chitinophaga sp. GCM10012297]|uniref:histidine kinase n=1 Tax=Chitinophaga chungangae TaxID=2821488 RepID=A0ABS3YI44_9BACT|nr:response regulator [Chitinophaga chungangae]MBO9154309.1 response regulator [Chitinophaga chungangae]
MKKLIQSLLNAGTAQIEDSRVRRSIVIINTLSLLTAVMVALVTAFLYWYTRSLLILIPSLLEICCFAGVIMLNYYHRHNAASVATLLIHCCFGIYFGSVLGNAMPIELITAFLFTFLIGASFLVFKNLKVRLISLACAIFLIVAVQLNDYFNIVQPMYVVPALVPVLKMGCWGGMLILMAYVTFFIIRQNDMFLKENQQLLSALKEANAAKSKFLRETSHEIRTPLNAVFGIAQLLHGRKHQIDDPELQQDINYLYAAGFLSREIVNNVLDMAKIEAGKYSEPVMEAVSLKENAESCVALNRYVAATRRVRIQLAIDPSIPEYIRTDHIFLSKIINNLLSNAVKFSTPGAGVEVRFRQWQQQLYCSVKNEGHLRAEQLDKVFQPFEAERNGQVEGTGLGLQITRHLVQLLGGEIVAENQGEQIQFEFRIPLQAATALTSEAGGPAVEKGEFNGYKVLVIEDDLFSGHVIRKFLSEAGADTLLADSGEEGLELLEAYHPDLLITDSHLPGIQGREVLARLRGMPSFRHLPVIIASGDAFTEAREEMIRAGANDYLVKPFLYADLHKLLEKYLPARVEQVAG